MAKALVVVSLICFALAALSVGVSGFSSLPLIALGLAFYVASSLVG